MPFSIPQMKDFVPEKLRPWIIVVMVIIVQLSGGVYMAAAGEMVGSTALLQEDIMMAGYASLVGMALFFPIMFRLRSAVRPKTAFMLCGAYRRQPYLDVHHLGAVACWRIARCRLLPYVGNARVQLHHSAMANPNSRPLGILLVYLPSGQ